MTGSVIGSQMLSRCLLCKCVMLHRYLPLYHFLSFWERFEGWRQRAWVRLCEPMSLCKTKEGSRYHELQVMPKLAWRRVWIRWCKCVVTMTRAALVKLAILMIIAFIMCLPEFFSIHRGGSASDGNVSATCPCSRVSLSAQLRLMDQEMIALALFFFFF